MTRHRLFKQHVRDRMARTGESYSTARRHVLARVARDAPEPWPTSYPGAVGTHHDTGLLYNLLSAAGVTAPHTGEPWSEPMLVGLAGGIGFMYFVFEYEGHHPTMTIVARHHPDPYLPAALTRAGVPFTLAHTSSARKATRALRAVLDGGGAAICTVARDSLAWYESRGELYSQDPHDVAVIGADGLAGAAGPGRATLFVDDGQGRPIAVGQDEFVAAWSAYRKGKHSLLTVGSAAPGSTVDLSAAVADAVATTCAHLTGPVLGNHFDANFGFRGAHKFVAQLRDPAGKTGWSQRYADPEARELALHRLADCLEVDYAGPGALRPIYADFLDEAAGALGRPAYAEAAGLFRRAGERWSSVATLAVTSEAGARALFDELADRAEAAVSGEEEAVALLTSP